MQKSEFFRRLGVIFNRCRIAADFSLGKDNSDTHGTHSLLRRELNIPGVFDPREALDFCLFRTHIG
jgi:hypothetical protein